MPANGENSSRTQAARFADQITSVSTPGTTAYKIGAQDILEVSVFKVADLSKSVQVSEGGTINMPLLGEVAASGRTARELEQELTRSLGAKYLQNPQVTVYVKEYNSQRVTLEGSGIKKPGVYPIRGRMTLLQLVATAEGLSDISDSQLVVFRSTNGKKTAGKFDIAAIRTGDAPDPELMAGDVVVAPTSAGKETLNTVIKIVPLAAFATLL